MVFNGARLGTACSVALDGAVHIGCRLEPETRVAIGWAAVGDPAELHPPGDVDAIRGALEEQGGFLPFVFGIDQGLRRPEAMHVSSSRHVRGLASHQTDRVVG